VNLVSDRHERAVPTYPDLAGKVAAVTGGSRGIGAATCRMLAANGVAVAVNGRSEDAIEAIVDELRAAGARATGFAGDCRSAADMERFRAHTETELGPADILLPFAGGFESFTPVQEIDADEWRAVIDANLTATHLTVQAFLPGFIERRSGAIVTMATNGARVLDKPLTASYVAAKAGVIQYTRHVAKELGPLGIRANAIAPATVSSERIKRIMDDTSIERTAALSPLGRMGTPEDCALTTLFLVSDSAAWLTGVTIDIAGGRVMM
jgi:3-oxoacyl-[acyl-carrier protein] reductase